MTNDQQTPSFRLEPFLWIHLAGLAVFPLLLQATWMGLAVGEPWLPFWLEFFGVAIAGIGPILWMQWKRPFDIFSLLFVAIRPQQLTPEQRQILRLFKTTKHRILTIVAAVVMLWVLWQLYLATPIAVPAAARLPQSRWLGLGLAAVAFLGSNLFLQVPISVLGVLLTSRKQYEASEPLETEDIGREFAVLGFRVKQILPPVNRAEIK